MAKHFFMIPSGKSSGAHCLGLSEELLQSSLRFGSDCESIEVIKASLPIIVSLGLSRDYWCKTKLSRQLQLVKLNVSIGYSFWMTNPDFFLM